MTLDLEHLRRLAKAATPGVWESFPKEQKPDHVWGPDGDAIAFAFGNLALGGDESDNASFIAAMNPETTLRLLDELEDARRVIARAKEQICNDECGEETHWHDYIDEFQKRWEGK